MLFSPISQRSAICWGCSPASRYPERARAVSCGVRISPCSRGAPCSPRCLLGIASWGCHVQDPTERQRQHLEVQSKKPFIRYPGTEDKGQNQDHSPQHAARAAKETQPAGAGSDRGGARRRAHVPGAANHQQPRALFLAARLIQSELNWLSLCAAP